MIRHADFAMLKVAGNRLIPLFVLSRDGSIPLPSRNPRVSLEARGAHPDWCH